jgi:membrane protein DedA with SNARE-associated domain
VRALGLRLSALAVAALVHRHAHASGVNYLELYVGSVISWGAFPGPGEAALIAAGISAAHHHLALASVLAVAWAGAASGATAAWLVGLKGGRGLLTARGPLQRLRLSLIARGERFYERFGPLAVMFTPPLIAGIHNMRWTRFLPAIAVSTLLWAAAIGVGAFLIGPSIADIAADAGLAGASLVVLIFIVTAVVFRRRRSHV